MLFVGIYTIKPLDFSVFPSLLLIVTLLRLSLNIGTTRLILLNGHEGPEAAGHLIAAFGAFVVGGNYVVGLIIFIILIVINFVVITKGAGRIAEVSARFTLDAMPGKQMSIDADLNAGLINETDARNRRQTIELEADFYGAMDGASKFVRGDAIAGIIIMIINLVAGLIIGILEHDLSVSDAARSYMLLTVGDGLVSQIPSLVVSTGAALVVTRAATDKNLSATVSSQMMLHPRALGIASGMLFLFGTLPGMPLIPFWVLAIAAGGGAWASGNAETEKENAKTEASETEAAADAESDKPALEMSDALQPVDLVSLEVGYGLIGLVDAEQNGDLLDRIRSLRRQFASEWGFLVPPVHIRDNLELGPSTYSILIKGCEVANGELHAGHMLAMASGDEDLTGLSGIDTVEPAFGLPAKWIPDGERDKAQSLGFTVVDPSTVIATHLTEILKNHVHELITRQETQNLIDSLAKKYPKAIDGVIPETVSLGLFQKVLQNLLVEQVPIRDLLTIIETIVEKITVTTSSDILTEHVREALSRHITRQYLDSEGRLYVMMLDPKIEDLIARNSKITEQGFAIGLEPSVAQQIISSIEIGMERWSALLPYPVVLCLPSCRGPLRKLVEKFIPGLAVVSHNEITSNISVESVGVAEFMSEVA